MTIGERIRFDNLLSEAKLLFRLEDFARTETMLKEALQIVSRAKEASRV